LALTLETESSLLPEQALQNMSSGLSFEASAVKSTNRFAALNLVEDSEKDDESSDEEMNAAEVHVPKRLSQIIDRGSAVAPKEHSKKASAENDPFQSKECPKSYLDRQVVDERIRNDSLCLACQAILGPHQVFNRIGETDTQILHKEYSSLDSAVGAGCYICSLLKQKLEFLVEDTDTRLEESKKLESDFQSLRYHISQNFELRLKFQYSGSVGITRLNILRLKMCYVSGMSPQIRLENHRLTFPRYRRHPLSHAHHKLGSVQKRHRTHSILAPPMPKQPYELLTAMDFFR
jgi:hypothetical protein